MKCTIEIYSGSKWLPCCLVETAELEAGHPLSSSVTYFPSYSGLPASIHCPVRSEPYRFDGWPPFMLDLLPKPDWQAFLHQEYRLPETSDIAGQTAFLAAINPAGCIRIKEAHEAYLKYLSGKKPEIIGRGFSEEELAAREDSFSEYMEEHGILSSGMACLKNRVPSFFMNRGKDGLFHADAVLPDSETAGHFMIKFSPDRNLADRKVLRNEAGFLLAAKEAGLYVRHMPVWRENMLFVPRFDREMKENRVIRYPLESLVSLCRIKDESAMPDQYAAVRELRRFAADPYSIMREYLLRDMLNAAAGNTDTHPANIYIQQTGAGIRLAPLEGLAPSSIMLENFTRSMEWHDEKGDILKDWAEIISKLDIPDTERTRLQDDIRKFAAKTAVLPEILSKSGVEEDLIEGLYYNIAALQVQLKAF